MKNDIWVFVLMIMAFCTPTVHEAICYYGELYALNEKQYIVCGSYWGLGIGFALAGSLIGRFSKYYRKEKE